jgi:hypothetical protein
MKQKRDNDYYRGRLKKSSREDLLAKVDSGQMSMHAACVAAGFRKKRSEPTLEGFKRSWQLLSKNERWWFVASNFVEMNTLVRSVGEKLQAKKP